MAPKRRFPRQGIVVMGYCPIARAQKFGKDLCDLNIHETASQLLFELKISVFRFFFTKTGSGQTDI